MGKDLKGKELGVGILQEKNGYYCARFVDKSGKRRSKRFKKLQECRQWLADMTFYDQTSDIYHPDDMSVQGWYDYWIDLKQKIQKPHTIAAYKNRYEKNIKPVIGSMLLTDVRTLHIQTIFIQMSNNYNNKTIQLTKAVLFNMFKLAFDNNIIMKNPCTGSLSVDIGSESEERKSLTISEQEKLLSVVDNYVHSSQFKFVLQTGLRVGELIGLEWSDIDLEKKELHVKRTMDYSYKEHSWVTTTPKTKKSLRTIPLTQEAIRILKIQKGANKIIPIEWKDKVFLSDKGIPIETRGYNQCLARACKAAGIKRISMHILRHTFATRCIEGGMKPKTLQTILGHANIGMTMNLYVDATNDEKHKEIGLVEEALKVI